MKIIKKIISFIFLFPLVLLVSIFILGFLDNSLGLGICRDLLKEVFYVRKCNPQVSSMIKCYTKQRDLIYAIEDYNLNHPIMMTTLDKDELVRSGYLKGFNTSKQ